MCELQLTVGIMSCTALLTTLCVKGGTHPHFFPLPELLGWLGTVGVFQAVGVYGHARLPRIFCALGWGAIAPEVLRASSPY